MESRFISAVAFYGPKTGRLRELLTGVQALIAEHVGADFRPYTLEQVHGTLIALNGVREGGTIVNEYLLEHAGVRQEMDLPRVMDILARRFAVPLRVRIGGFRPDQAVPFRSRGQHLAERISPCKARRSCWWDGRPTRWPAWQGRTCRWTSSGAR